MEENNTSSDNKLEFGDPSKQSKVNEPPERVDDRSLAEIAKVREVEIRKKQAVYNKISGVLKIILILLVLASLVFYMFKKKEETAPQPFVVAPQPTTQPVDKPDYETDLASWIVKRSDVTKVFVRHPYNSTILESNDPPKLDIVYFKDGVYPAVIDETTINQGYIFRVTPLDVGVRTFDDIVDVKRESFKVKCPATAVFSQTTTTLVDTVDARRFQITNCDSDYVIYIVPRFNIYYEIALIYKGDFGYKQKYKAVLEEMLRTFRFFPEESNEPIGYYKRFTNDEFKFAIMHPSLDTTCCTVPQPPVQNIRHVVTFGDRSTFKDESNLDAIGIFTIPHGGQLGLATFVEDQKRLLREDYKVVTGVEPVTETREIKVGGYNGFWLKGYSWRGNELIYAEIETNWRKLIFVFSIKNASGESFENKVVQMLETFEKLSE